MIPFLALLTLMSLFQTPTTPPPDKRIGVASFRVFQHGNDIVLIPAIAAEFKLSLLAGPKPVTDEVQQCTVYARYYPMDDKTVTVATVLKCGESEYGVAEVDFVQDAKSK